MVLGKLWWLGTRLAGYPGRTWEPRDLPDGTLLNQSEGCPIPGSSGVELRELTYVSDGLAVKGYALWPEAAEEALPVILYGRGGLGPHGVVEQEDLAFLADLAQGGPYLVLATQYRGNHGGEGEDRADEGAARDLANLQHLAAALPGAAPDRLAVVGYSRGGTMAFMAARQGLKPRAIATIGCVTDLAQAFREGDILLRSAIRISTGGVPSLRRRPAYRARSPVYWADEISAPCLLLHGDRDEVVRDTQSRRLAEALQSRGRSCTLEILPGGDHRLDTHPKERRDRILTFLRPFLDR